MSLAPELAAFIGQPIKPTTPGKIVRGYAGLGGDGRTGTTHDKENDMPRGVYDRKPKTDQPKEATAPARPEKRKAAPAGKRVKKAATPRKAPRRAAKPVVPLAAGPRFGVFEDGSVEVRLPDCRGTISGDDAAALHAFITKLRG